ncbi:hypothetical protein GCM10010340_34280 [Streptomyces griseoloalbus]|nr:hypothetical protein GCM10010340_34280 [Streptomyces albaduncus]
MGASALIGRPRSGDGRSPARGAGPSVGRNITRVTLQPVRAVTGFGAGPSSMRDPRSGVAVTVTVVATSGLAVRVPVGAGLGSPVPYGSHADWWRSVPAGLLVQSTPPASSWKSSVQ